MSNFLEKRKARKEKRRSKRAGEPLGVPSLNSLMDVVTIVLVYLIKSFVVNPISVQDPSVELPRSNSQETSAQAIVVMVTGKQRRDVEGNTAGEVEDTPAIVVDDKVIGYLDAKSYRVPEKMKERGYVITRLKDELMQAKRDQAATAAITEGEGFTGQVVIVADRDTPYRVITDILMTCGAAGFGEFKFAVVKNAS